MTEVRCKDTIIREHRGVRERERERERERVEVKEGRDRGGEINESLLLFCGTRPQ